MSYMIKNITNNIQHWSTRLSSYSSELMRIYWNRKLMLGAFFVLYIYICISTVLKRIVEVKKDILANLQYWQENSQTILGKVLPKQYQDLSVYPKEHINLYITRFLSWEKTWMKLSVCNSPSKLLEIFLTYTTNFTE